MLSSHLIQILNSDLLQAVIRYFVTSSEKQMSGILATHVSCETSVLRIVFRYCSKNADIVPKMQ